MLQKRVHGAVGGVYRPLIGACKPAAKAVQRGSSCRDPLAQKTALTGAGGTKFQRPSGIVRLYPG